LFGLTYLHWPAGVCANKHEEGRRVIATLKAAAEHAEKGSFWESMDNARALALLQDRVGQVTTYLESCRAAFALIHRVMFPLNAQPVGLPALMERFRNGQAIYSFVRQHLICGANVAMSFVRVRYPHIDMEAVGTLPETPSGRTDMGPHYAACIGAAKKIAEQIIEQSDRERLGREQQVPST
jgi:hypothetical protein